MKKRSYYKLEKKKRPKLKNSTLGLWLVALFLLGLWLVFFWLVGWLVHRAYDILLVPTLQEGQQVTSKPDNGFSFGKTLTINKL